VSETAREAGAFPSEKFFLRKKEENHRHPRSDKKRKGGEKGEKTPTKGSGQTTTMYGRGGLNNQPEP